MSIRMLTVKQAAQATGLSTKAIYHHIQRRTIPFKRIGAKKVIFLESDLAGWIEAMQGVSLEESLDRIRQRGNGGR